MPLADRVGVFASGWDGRTLTKTGPGLLIVSAPLIHTGGTLIDGGTLRTDVTDSLATSSNVNIASGATLDMNGFAQQINQLSGAGAIALGGAALTAVNLADTAFSGTIGGSGSVVKTGPATLSLSGASTYSGGTTIATGKLIAATGTALGAGAVTNNAILQLDFANDALMLNTLSGSGALLKRASARRISPPPVRRKARSASKPAHYGFCKLARSRLRPTGPPRPARPRRCRAAASSKSAAPSP